MRLLLELFFDLVVAPGRVCHIEPPQLIEVRRNRPVDQRWPGDLFECEAVGQGERIAIDLELSRLKL